MSQLERVPTTATDRGSATPTPTKVRRRPVLSARLQVGAVDDPLEREADVIATTVMARIGDGAIDEALFGPAPGWAGRIARRSGALGGVIGPAGGDVDDAMAARIRSSSGGGRPLDATTMGTMQGAFQTDLSAVRIHRASDLPAQVGALAFTLGSDVHFSPGQYRPTTPGGQWLLAHELTHVIQQSSTSSSTAQAYAIDRRPIIRRGSGESVTKTPVCHKLTEKDVDYTFKWVTDTADEGLVDVFSDIEDERIGYVAFSFRTVLLKPAPAPNEPFTKEHVLGRTAGVVCHLSQIMNLSLLRDGPDDIYSGFANTLMRMVEDKARERNARLIYLEPAPSNVRIDPNTNEKKMQDPTGFYTGRHKYSADAAAAIHNAAYTAALYQGMGVSEEQLAKQTEAFNRAVLGGILVKNLV